MAKKIELIKDVELIDIEKISEYENNPKQHPQEQIEKIANSIKKFKFTVPILIDSNNQIIAGHGRYKAALLLGLSKISAIRRDDLSEEQVRELRLADNKIAESAWDYDKLAVELEYLQANTADLEITGFSNQEIDDILANLEPDPEDDFDNTELSLTEFDEFEQKCPKCGYEWDE